MRFSFLPEFLKSNRIAKPSLVQLTAGAGSYLQGADKSSADVKTPLRLLSFNFLVAAKLNPHLIASSRLLQLIITLCSWFPMLTCWSLDYFDCIQQAESIQVHLHSIIALILLPYSVFTGSNHALQLHTS